jgi:hypothetical protein
MASRLAHRSSSSALAGEDPTGSRVAAPRLEHLRGEPWARIGERVGQRNLAVTANTYTHVLADESELDYATLVTTWKLAMR